MPVYSSSDVLQKIRNYSGSIDDLPPSLFAILFKDISKDLQFESCIAVKGEGVIIKAYSRSIQRSVAVKVALPGRMHSAGKYDIRNLRDRLVSAVFSKDNGCVISTKLADRFRLSGRVQAFLSNALSEFGASAFGKIPNVHYGTHGDKNPTIIYFVMDYINGEHLIDWSQTKDEFDILSFFLDLIKLVEFGLHTHGIAHCDLKPDNIMVMNNKPVILDFGICKNMKADYFNLTNVGEDIGTVYVMPTEARKNAKERDFLVDIYQLGLILWVLWAKGLPDFSDVLDPNTVDFRGNYFISEIFQREDLPFGGIGFIYEKMTTRREERYVDISEVRLAVESYMNMMFPKHKVMTGEWKSVIKNKELIPIIEKFMAAFEEII